MPPEQMTYEWFGESYSFTEDQTDSLSLEALEWWPLIRLARLKAQETSDAQNARVQGLTAQTHNGQGVPFTAGMRTPGSG